jgi:hypothetical protein
MKSSWDKEKYAKGGKYADSLRRRSLAAYYRNAQKPEFRAREQERQREYRIERKQNPEELESYNIYMREYMRKYNNIQKENYKK